MQANGALKGFLQGKFSNTLYTEFFQTKVLILVLPYEKAMDKKAEVLKFCFEAGQIYEFKDDFKPLSEQDFSALLKGIFDDIKLYLNHCQDSLERKENAILKGKIVANFFRKSFVLKQKILKVVKFAMQSSESLKGLSSDIAELKNALKLHILMASNLEKTSRELLYQLDGLYSLISSIKSEKTNKNIYILSIISTIVLPLNLIVGFFGMNTGGLFLSQSPYGTAVVTLLIGAICLLGVWYYRYKTKQDLSMDENFNFEKAKSSLDKNAFKPSTKGILKSISKTSLESKENLNTFNLNEKENLKINSKEENLKENSKQNLNTPQNSDTKENSKSI